MMEMKKINVELYGGKGLLGGRETPLEADTIYCEASDRCTYYRNGKCLRCRTFLLSENCKYGEVHRKRGYTSKAAKYYGWKKNYTDDPEYHKLAYPNTRAAVIGDWLHLRTSYVDVVKHKQESTLRRVVFNEYDICGTLIGATSAVFIPLEQATNDFLYAIFSYRPVTLLGYEVITDYADKVVPEILQDLRACAPDIYERFVSEYPEYRKEPNYVGKVAYVESLKPGTVFRVEKRGEWLFDGEYVTAIGKIDIGLGSPWWTQGGASAEGVKIKVNPSMTFKVMDNSIVDDDTRFI